MSRNSHALIDWESLDQGCSLTSSFTFPRVIVSAMLLNARRHAEKDHSGGLQLSMANLVAAKIRVAIFCLLMVFS
jgi:hypothetical protein